MITDKNSARERRFIAAAKAIWPSDEWTAEPLRHEVTEGGVTLQWYGLKWEAPTFDACMDLAEAWCRETALKRVLERRRAYDEALERQRNVEAELAKELT